MKKLIRDHLSNSGKPFAKVIPSQVLKKFQRRCRDLMAGTLTDHAEGEEKKSDGKTPFKELSSSIVVGTFLLA